MTLKKTINVLQVMRPVERNGDNKRGFQYAYIVRSLVNCLDPAIDDEISAKRVEGLIAAGITVNVKGPSRD